MVLINQSIGVNRKKLHVIFNPLLDKKHLPILILFRKSGKAVCFLTI